MIRPFATGLVVPEWADRVVAPAYDALTAEERADVVANNPDSFLTVTRSPGDRCDAEDTGDVDALVANGKRSLERLVDAGAFVEETSECLYLYRLSQGNHSQVAVVGEVPISGYVDGHVKIHEAVRPDRVDVLRRHFSTLRVTSSPIAMTYHPRSAIDEVVRAEQRSDPILEIDGPEWPQADHLADIRRRRDTAHL